MRVVDTSAWIEHLLATPTGEKLSKQFPSPNDCIVPTIVQLELAKWANRDVNSKAARALLALTVTCKVIALDTTIATAAAKFCRTHKLATADAIIFATARHFDVELLTCDAHFKGLAGVAYFEKIAFKKQ
jgi:predicted nucleic acid-binding protein